jgi:hypothetical protein
MVEEVLMGTPEPGVIATLWADAAVLDAPAADAGIDSGLGDAGADTGEGGAAAGADGAADTGAGGGDQSGDLGDEAGLDDAAGVEGLTGAKLWHAVKAKLEGLDPKERGAINRTIHKLAAIEKALPEGGIEKVTATLAAVKQLSEDPAAPTEKVIADTLSERSYFRELDQAYTEAKPEFAEKLATASPEAFDKLAPMVFAKYSETNPEGFAKFVAETALSHAQSMDVPLHFKVLSTFLPQLADGPAKDQVIAAVEGIYGWSQALKGFAAKTPAAKVGAGKTGEGDGKALETREQQLAERETQVTLKSWNNEALQPGIRAVYAEADKIAGKQKLTGDERKKVLSKVGEELDIRLAANKGYGETMRGYLKSGNKQSFIQRLESERKKLIPGAVRRAVDDVVAERPKPVTKKAGAAEAGTKPGTAAAGAADAGDKVEWIAGHPSTLGQVVDLNRTTHAMLLKKRAYVKGKATPVAWK